MRTLIAATALITLLASSASSLQTEHQQRAPPVGKNIRVGKTTELSSSKSMFLSRYGKGSNQPVDGSVWPVSIYWTTVEVGTPAVSYAVAIDSGSWALYLSGKNCDGCIRTPPNKQYDPGMSKTSSPVGRNFSASYVTCNPTHPTQSCTVSGPEYNDVASLAGYAPVGVKLGVIEYQTSNFYQFQTIDGIMGMVHRPGTGNNANETVFYQECAVEGKCANVWAICMYEGSQSNGTITIGGVDESLAEGPIVYVPSSNSSEPIRHMRVNTLDFSYSIGGPKQVSFETSSYAAILDTGTNDILLPTAVFDATKKSFCDDNVFGELKHCESFFTNGTFCATLTDDEVAKYPGLKFRLDRNVTLEIDSGDYLLKNSPAATSPDQYCFGLSNGGGYFILGDTLMKRYYLVFAETEVGWGKVNKNTCGSK